MTRRPNKKTVAAVIQWLQDDLDLSIYGAAVDLTKGVIHPGNMDYSADDVEKLAVHLRNDTLVNHKDLDPC